MSKSAEKCIECILQDIEKRKTVDYGDKNSVRRYNAAYDRIAKNVTYIEEHYPDKIDLFIQLIHHADSQISFTCACLVINQVHCSREQKCEAIEIIRKLLKEGKVYGLSEVTIPIVLKTWEIEYQNED